MKKWNIILILVAMMFIIIGIFAFQTKKPLSGVPQLFATPTPYPTLALKQSLTSPNLLTNAPSLPVDISTLSYVIPHTVNLYRITSRSIPTQIITSFVNTFTLSEGTHTSGIRTWISPDQTRQLVVTDSGYLTYANSYLPPKDSAQKITNADQAVSAATQLATTLQIKAADFSQTQVEYAIEDGSHLVSTTDFSQANVVGIVFQRVITSLPLYAQGGNTDSMVFWINKYGIAEKITFQYTFIDGYESLPSPSPDSLQSRLLKGEGAIVASPVDNPTFTSITPKSAEVAYFDDRVSSLIQPILVVKGSGDSDKGIVPVTIYLPLFKQ